MQTVLRKMGNSMGIILPKAVLGELGIANGQSLDLQVEDGRIVATPVQTSNRAGWASAAEAIGAQDDPEAAEWESLPHEDDDALIW